MEQPTTFSSAVVTARKAVLKSQRGKVAPSPKSVFHTFTQFSTNHRSGKNLGG